MFQELDKINLRPKPFEYYTASDLWTDEHISQRMLSFHLDESGDYSSRNGAFIDRSVDWIVSRFNVGAGTKIADFGCGPGLYAIRLARKEAKLTGIDFSARSIQYAKEAAKSEGLSINYVNQNYLDFESDERYELILLIMCDFCALSPVQRRRLLEIFHRHLEPRGAVVLDVYSMAAFEQRSERAVYELGLFDGFWASARYYGFANSFKYEDEKLLLDKYTIVEPARTRTIYNWLQCFTPEGLGTELSNGGFTAAAYYGDVSGADYAPEATEFAVVAKKL